jgi:hypothetical protein
LESHPYLWAFPLAFSLKYFGPSSLKSPFRFQTRSSSGHKGEVSLTIHERPRYHF